MNGQHDHILRSCKFTLKLILVLDRILVHLLRLPLFHSHITNVLGLYEICQFGSHRDSSPYDRSNRHPRNHHICVQSATSSVVHLWVSSYNINCFKSTILYFNSFVQHNFKDIFISLIYRYLHVRKLIISNIYYRGIISNSF